MVGPIMVFIKGGDVNALLGYKLKLNFPPAIPLELLMRARCALVGTVQRQLQAIEACF